MFYITAYIVMLALSFQDCAWVGLPNLFVHWASKILGLSGS